MKKLKHICLIALCCMLSIFTLQVKADIRKVNDDIFSVNKSKIVLDVGKKCTLSSNQKVTWKSANKKVVSVTKKGIVKIKKKGRTYITAISKSTGAKIKIPVYAGGYKISKSRFPDKGFRNFIKLIYDKNKDGYLSNKERKVKCFTIDAINIKGETKNWKKLNKAMKRIKNLKGIKYFDKIKGIYIADINNIKEIDVSGMKKLGYIFVNGADKLKVVQANNCSKLVGIEVYASNRFNLLSLRNCKNLSGNIASKDLKRLSKDTGLNVVNKIFVYPEVKKIDITNTLIDIDKIVCGDNFEIIK